MGNDVYLSIGTNIGNLLSNLEEALKLIEKRFKNIRVSDFYKTAPQDYRDQDYFLNGAVFFETGLKPLEVLTETREIEKSLGQGKKEIRFGPRLIDIDIVLYGNNVINGWELTIPHPRMEKRAFVLYPVLDLNPGLVHPVTGKKLSEYLNNKDVISQEIIKI